MLDALLVLQKNRDNTKGLLELLQEGHLITAEVSSMLWESLMGVEGSEPDGDAVHRGEPVR